MLAGWVAVCGCGRGEWCRIPADGEGTQELEMGRCEVTTGDFMEWLAAGGAPDFPETAQVRRATPSGAWRLQRGVSRRAAMAEVTPAEAEGYAAWRSRREGRLIRLPTATEWEFAARGGIRGAPWSWGWGGRPEEMACVAADEPLRRVGALPANGYGLREVCGNVYEWTAAEETSAEMTPAALPARAARGGAWSEPMADSLRLDRIQRFPADYRGRDVGFRLVREPVMKENEASGE